MIFEKCPKSCTPSDLVPFHILYVWQTRFMSLFLLNSTIWLLRRQILVFIVVLMNSIASALAVSLFPPFFPQLAEMKVKIILCCQINNH